MFFGVTARAAYKEHTSQHQRLRVELAGASSLAAHRGSNYELIRKEWPARRSR